MASVGLFIYLFNFLTAASAKAAEFSLCRSSKLRVSGGPASSVFLLVFISSGILSSEGAFLRHRRSFII